MEHFELFLGANDDFVVGVDGKFLWLLLLLGLGIIADGKGLHVLVNDLDMDDGGTVFKAHLFSEEAVDYLIGAGLDRWHVWELLLSLELEGIDVDDAGVGSNPE